VPFFLEPGYMDEPAGFTEMHNTRMVRKFGSMQRFLAVQKGHGLIPRGGEVGLDASVGWDQPQLDKRVQSSTLRSHRLVRFMTARHGADAAERFYAAINRRHFLEAGVLNDDGLLTASLAEAGLADGALTEAVSYLHSDEGAAEVLATYDRVQAMGIHSIPTLVVDAKHTVSGAARMDEILSVLERVLAEGASGGKRLFDDVQ
jgi:predicted DsbA family dithiol-disulfide isomerase